MKNRKTDPRNEPAQLQVGKALKICNRGMKASSVNGAGESGDPHFGDSNSGYVSHPDID